MGKSFAGVGAAVTALDASGLAEESPVAHELAIQALGYVPFSSGLYKKGINHFANKYRTKTPAVADADGNVISQHTVHLKNKNGKLKYVGETGPGQPVPKKDI